MIDVGPFTTAQARKSTLVVAAVLTAIGGWQLYRGRETAAIVLAVAVGVLVLCAAIPPAARFFHKWWMTLAGVLGYVNSRIILGILYFFVVTPIGFVVRLSGYDPLTRRIAKAPSYWRRRDHTRQTREGFERAF